ncbi:hypothetical protein ACFRQM_44395 [Streptomyces sp. NPDC056831]|uniref:hypothetical protein n=1 Tax=Streptomyces sp. NPDC056831 TaxID=3345954 RepID=UPI00369F8539
MSSCWTATTACPWLPARTPLIEVTFDIDADSVLHVRGPYWARQVLRQGLAALAQ